MYSFVLYPNPLDARVTLKPDSSGEIGSMPYTDPSGRQGQVCQVGDLPDAQGAELNLSAPGYLPLRVRGFLMLAAGVARLQVDDYTLSPEPVAPPTPDTPPPSSGPRTPQEIIQGVYGSTHPNLATVDGCGQFTEDCCTALHTEHSQAWGHIDKDPGQNQYHGHAVDALMLLGTAQGVTAGIYDIIFSSASAEAKPAFNYVEPPRYEDWVYPAEAATRGAVAPSVPFNYPRRQKGAA